ncbi:MAG TPA: hypothetical protein VFM11_01355 [Burkholderiales bacterium]|nr:hypothetical protein [Burkholderiales bacterium]
MLRRVLITVGVAALLAALGCALGGIWEVAAYLFVIGIALAVGIPFERWRYTSSNGRGKQKSFHGDWQPTGERFMDPASGQLLEVYYNPQTGERDYRGRQA